METETKSVRPEKGQIVQDIQALIESSGSFFLVTWKGLTTMGFSELRDTVAEAEGVCHVVPNRLFRRAAAECGIEGFADDALKGDTAFVGGPDSVALAKCLRDFGRVHGEVSFKAGVTAGSILSAAQSLTLADLPPRDVLRAQVLGLLQAPSGKLVGVLSAKLSSIVYVLNAYLNEKEAAA